MSLDVSLYSEGKVKKECIHCGSEYEYRECLFDANITHNLGEMAYKAGIYDACWRPYRLHKNYIPSEVYEDESKFEKSVVMKAKDILPLLEKGYCELKAKPEYFEQFNSDNGWGLYKNFLPWVEKYLNACKNYPDAIIEVRR